MNGSALHDCTTQSSPLRVSQVRRPMAAIAYSPGHDSLAVDVRPGGQIVEHTRKNPLRPYVRLNRGLPGAGHVHRDHTDAAAEHRVPRSEEHTPELQSPHH